MTFVCLPRRTSHKMACSMTIFCARQTSVAFGGPLHDVRLGQEARGLRHAEGAHGRHRNGQAV